ncbi:MAG: hypothetical protein VYD19_11710 [Myxococcota bacterium]|nr:hypothetical protein [Myxococcota bacterium]
MSARPVLSGQQGELLRELQSLWVDQRRILRRRRWALRIPDRLSARAVISWMKSERGQLRDREGYPISLDQLTDSELKRPLIIERERQLSAPDRLSSSYWWDGWLPLAKGAGTPLQRYTASLPRQPKTSWFALGLGEPHSELRRGRVTLSWRAQGSGQLSPQLYLSAFHHWAELDRWLAPFYQRPVNALRSTRGESAALERRVRTLYLQLRARVRVQKQPLRAYHPRSPRETLALGAGDCKDMNYLLMDMLAREGIESIAALTVIGVARPFSAELASPGWFNHLLLYLPTLGRWLDASDPRPWAPSAHGRRAFLLTGRGGVLTMVGAKPRF